jgi:hypothetical protein
VVGHLGHRIMRALGPSHRGCPIRYIGSDNFASTNNVTSLALASAYQRPILICDCDIVLQTLPATWLEGTDCDLAVPVRAMADGETGCVLDRTDDGRWGLRVERRRERDSALMKKSLSLYLVFNACLATAIYEGCIAAIHDDEVDLYYEDIIARVAAAYSVGAIDMEAAGYRSFEIDTPLDLERAEEFLRRARSEDPSSAGRSR